MAVLILGCAARAATGANVVVITSAFVEQLAAEARTNHPAVRAAEARAAAARFDVAAARTWEDPVARAGVMGAASARRKDDGDLEFGVEQKLPLFGKATAARRMAEAEAATERHRTEFRAHQLRREITERLVKLALADCVVEFGAQDLAWLDTLVISIEERFRNSTGTQLEVLQSQNERARRANALRTAETNAWHERVSLNRLVARKLDSPWPQFLLPPVADALPPAQELVRHAFVSAPQLRVMRSGIRHAQASLDAAERARYPDITTGAEVRQYSGSGEVLEGTVMLSLSIPWANRSRYRAGIRREESKLEAARHDVVDMEWGISDEITRLASQIDSARREALLFRDDIIPRSEQALATAQAAWAGNRAMFRDVLEARRMLIDAQTMRARAVAEQFTMLGELILHCGLHEFGTMESLKLAPPPQPLKP